MGVAGRRLEGEIVHRAVLVEDDGLHSWGSLAHAIRREDTVGYQQAGRAARGGSGRETVQATVALVAGTSLPSGPPAMPEAPPPNSEERRAGNEGVRRCRSRVRPYKKNNN